MSAIDPTDMKHMATLGTTVAPKDLLVPIATVAGAPRLLADLGASVRAVARAAGLDPTWFDDPTQTISFRDVGRYLTECVRVTGDDTFPLRLGLAEGLSALTVVGYLAQHSPDLQTALGEIRCHVHHFAGAIEVTQENGAATLEYRFLLSDIDGAGLIAEAGMGIGISILQQLCGASWKPVEIHLTRRPPRQAARWRECVRAPLCFAAERNLLIFRADWLTHRLERSNAVFRRLLDTRVAALDARHGEHFPSQVAAAIHASLLAGDASTPAIASRLNLSPRTLRRRLSEQQMSLQVLIEKTRLEVACHLLETSSASMTQIADLLGYAHSSALSRAFRRWTDVSPREWRTRAMTRHGS